MKRRIRVEQEADEDLTSAVEYYRRDGGEEVALRFVERVYESFELLAREPGVGRTFSRAKTKRLRSLQAWPIAKFPFVVFYEADDRELRLY